jgi:hypothetical protein
VIAAAIDRAQRVADGMLDLSAGLERLAETIGLTDERLAQRVRDNAAMARVQAHELHAAAAARAGSLP